MHITKKYSGNKIEAVDRISSISSSKSDAIISTSDWTFFLDDDNPIIVDLRKGTLIKVTGELYGNGLKIFVDTIEIIEEK